MSKWYVRLIILFPLTIFIFYAFLFSAKLNHDINTLAVAAIKPQPINEQICAKALKGSQNLVAYVNDSSSFIAGSQFRDLTKSVEKDVLKCSDPNQEIVIHAYLRYVQALTDHRVGLNWTYPLALALQESEDCLATGNRKCESLHQAIQQDKIEWSNEF